MKPLEIIVLMFYASFSCLAGLLMWSVFATKYGEVTKAKADKAFWIALIITCVLGIVWGLIGGVR